MQSDPKKPKAQKAKPLESLNSLVPQDAKGAELYPNLMDCLMPRWVDGQCVRQSGSLRMRIVGSWFLLSLTCPTEGVETSVTLDTVVKALEALEKTIASGKAVWTPTFERQKKAGQARID